MTALEIALRLAIDAAAAAALIHGLYLRRHRRRDLAVVYAMFHGGLFLALLVIAGGEVSMGVGFGLFAVLSIVRLRSEPFSNRELAYFFVALVLALVCAIDLGSPLYAAGLAAVAVALAWAVDREPPAYQLEVSLELVFADRDALRRHLEERLGAPVVDLEVLEIDYVREITRARVRHGPPRERVEHAVLAG